MKISLTTTQYLDIDGKPLVAGMLKVHLHGSDTLADTFILSGNDFVQGSNPIILDNAGELTNTVFVEAAIYDVEVFKNVDGQYAKISDFQFGFNMPNAKNDTVVYGIDGLADADPELGFVNVVGYNNITYAGQRMYMWDAQCTDPADGGCIIASRVEDTGRWLLLSDLREMPCTYYGVEAAHEANLSAFLTYQPVVGTYGIFMPPVPRFVAGTYSTVGTISCTKTVSFDKGAHFPNATLYVDTAEITPSDDYVADFIFRSQSYAESCWFKTVKAFWACGAYELHQSRTNYFQVLELPAGQTAVANAKITGRPIAMQGTGCLFINNCDIADKALSTDWYTAFYNMTLSDKWFADSNWDVGTATANRQLPYQGHNTLDLVNFENPNVYILFAAAWNYTDLDMMGRACSYITAAMPFTRIANGSFESIAVGHDLELDNVRTNELHAIDANFTLRGSTATIAACTASTLTAIDSTVKLLCDIDSTATALNFTDSTIDLNLHKLAPASGNWNLNKETSFDGCNILQGSIYSNTLYLQRSRLVQVQIKVYPYNDNGSFSLSMDIGGNLFIGGSNVAIGADNGNGVQNVNVYDVEIKHLSITDNTFNTSVYGLSCPFWASDGQHRFLRGIVQTMGWTTDSETTAWTTKVYYHGNKGQCPAAYGGPSPDFDNIWHGIDFESDGETELSKQIHFPASYEPQKVFVVPATVDDGGTIDANNVWTIANTAKACTPYDPRYTVYNGIHTVSMPYLFPYVMYTPVCAWESAATNDLFSVKLGGSFSLKYGGAIPCPAYQ